MAAAIRSRQLLLNVFSSFVPKEQVSAATVACDSRLLLMSSNTHRLYPFALNNILAPLCSDPVDCFAFYFHSSAGSRKPARRAHGQVEGGVWS